MLVRPRATPPRPTRVGVGVLVAVLLLAATGCSGDEANGDEPSASPSLSLGASSEAAGADPADDEAALRRLMKAYERIDARADQAGNTDPSVYAGVLAPDYAELLVDNMKKFILADDLRVLGQFHYRVQSVEVDGDEATLEVCADGHEFFVVPESQKTIGNGATGQPSVLTTYTASRSADGWVLTDSDPKDKAC